MSVGEDLIVVVEGVVDRLCDLGGSRAVRSRLVAVLVECDFERDRLGHLSYEPFEATCDIDREGTCLLRVPVAVDEQITIDDLYKVERRGILTSNHILELATAWRPRHLNVLFDIGEVGCEADLALGAWSIHHDLLDRLL